MVAQVSKIHKMYQGSTEIFHLCWLFVRPNFRLHDSSITTKGLITHDDNNFVEIKTPKHIISSNEND